MQPATSVFISYRIESESHSQQVLSLASQLREDGIDAMIDRYVEAPREGWPRWTGRMIINSDIVICVCTAAYRQAFEGRNEPGGGLGVNAEGYYIMQELYESGYESDKYIPVFFLLGGSSPSAPAALRAFKHYYLPGDYESLYRRLSGQPAVEKPHLGRVREMPPLKKATALSEVKARSEGFEASGERHYSITPHDYTRNQLAPSEGVFISRIINPINRFDPAVVTTVWVAARGDDQYVLDSMRIKDSPGMGLGPSGGPALPPDAEYKFTFGEGTDRTHALNPTLSIGQTTRPYASFNLCLTPDTDLYTFGWLSVMLIYHTMSGRYGSLYLQMPDKIGVMLAKHLKQDVCVSIRQQVYDSLKHDYFEQVITPEGLQKGYEPEFRQYYQYIPIEMPGDSYFTFDRDTLVTLRVKFSGFMQARESLHQILNTGANLSQLGQWLADGLGFAADLLGGIGTDEATNILLDALAKEPGSKTIMTGLFVHHLVTGDDVLAAYTIANSEIVSSDDHLSTALFRVFLLRPTEHLPEVLQVIRKMQPDNIYAGLNSQIRLIKDDVSDDVYFACFDPDFGPLGAHVFVRGTMNNWAINAESDSQLIHNGDGKYETTLYLQADRHELKVADQNWTSETSFGSDSPDHTLNLNRPFWLTASNVSPNLVLDLSAAETGFYRFLLDTNDIYGPTLTVSPVDESNP